MRRVVCSTARVLGSGTDNDRDAGGDKLFDSLVPLDIAQQRPVSHRSAVDHRPHAGGARDEVRNLLKAEGAADKVEAVIFTSLVTQ